MTEEVEDKPSHLAAIHDMQTNIYKHGTRSVHLVCFPTPQILNYCAVKGFVLFSILISLHLLVTPYTKVEESFHIQAVHDIFINGLPSFPGFGGESNVEITHDAYDHFQFPGAVPRTAIGATVLAQLLSILPASWVVNGVDQQFLGMSST